MSRSMKTLSDRHHLEQPLSHHQPTQWRLKQTLLRPPRPKRPLSQHRELPHNPPQQEPRQQTCYRAYKECSEEQFQEELQEEEEVGVEQDLRAAEHQLHQPML